MKQTFRDSLGWTLTLLIVALFAAANLFGFRQLWGMRFYSYLPPFWTWLALAVVLISAIPPVAGAILNFAEKAGKYLIDNRRWRVVTGAGFVVICALLFWFFSERLPLLGDGGLRSREIMDGRLWKPTELGDLAIHALVYNWLSKPFGHLPTESYRIISVLSGILYLIGLYRLAAYVSKVRCVLWTAALCAVGCIVLFFGYVESYSIAAAFFPWLFLLGLRAADRKGSIVAFAALTVVGTIIHSVILILFGPALILLLMAQNAKFRESFRARKYIFLLAGVGAAVLLVALQYLDLPIARSYILPILSGDNAPAGIFSLMWFGNILNWILISGLAACAGAIVVATSDKTVEPVFENRLLVGGVTVSSILLILLWNPQLGGPLDWDLFSLPMLALGFAAIVAIESRAVVSIPRWIVPLVVLSALNLAGFVAVNASVRRSTDRFADIITQTGKHNLFQQWATLVEHAEHNPELYEHRNQYLTNAWQSPPYTRHDSIWTLVKLADTYTASGDSASASNAVQMLGAIDTLDVNIFLAKVGYLDRFGTPSQRIEVAQELVARMPDNPVALGSAGIIYFKLGRRDLCEPLLEKAYTRDSGNYLTALNYGVFLASAHSNVKAVPVLKRALELNNGSFLAPYYLATCYMELGDYSNAKTARLRAEANALRPEEQDRVKQLKGRF